MRALPSWLQDFDPEHPHGARNCIYALTLLLVLFGALLA